jgi:hypothetical protein
MFSNTYNNVASQAENINGPVLAVIGFSRNFSIINRKIYSDDQISKSVKMIQSSDLVAVEHVGTQKESDLRDEIYNYNKLRDYLQKFDIQKVKAIYIYARSHLESNSYYAIG